MSTGRDRECVLPRAFGVPLGLALCGVLVGGCFDAREVGDSGAALVWSTARSVDDAERSDGLPSWSMLGRWGYWSSPDGGATLQTVEPGADDRGRARSWTFDAEPEPTDEEPDPARVYTSVGLYAGSVVPVDLSGYDAFVFSAKLEPDATYPWPENLDLRIELSCRDAASSALGLYDPSLDSAVAPDVGGEWQTFGLALEDFIQPSWQIEAGQRIDPARCLRHVSGLGVVVGPNVPGVRLAGTLSLDDLELRTLHRARTPALPDVSLSPWRCYDVDGVATPSCDAPLHDTVVTLAEGPDGDGRPLVVQARCASVVALDGSSVLRPAELDMGAFDELSIAATFLPANPADARPGRFSVRLGCFDGSGHPASVVRSFGVSAGLASYQLGLASFVRDYTLKPLDCLAHVDSICVRPDDPTSENAVAGSLTVEELVLR